MEPYKILFLVFIYFNNYLYTSQTKLIDECPSLKLVCSNYDDLSILECIVNNNELMLSLTLQCQYSIKSHAKQLIEIDKLKELFTKECSSEDTSNKINAFKQCVKLIKSNEFFMCLIESLDLFSLSCKNLIGRVAFVAFDELMPKSFYSACKVDLKQCTKRDQLACLQNKIDKLQNECYKIVIKLSEVQSSNLIKFDKQLGQACKIEVKLFCGDYLFGSDGSLFECLVKNKNSVSMTPTCRDQLSRRQKLISRDYKISKGLSRACREDIKAHKCKKNLMHDDDKDLRLAQILLCLENTVHNGTKISPDCWSEMIDHRKMLWEDYHLSPEIATECAEDIKNLCNKLELKGKTIHCLMRNSMRKKISKPECNRALEDFIRETDAGENWQVDPVLRNACKPVVDVACANEASNGGGDAHVITCLMDKIGTAVMKDDCEQALMQIQYFIARNFKLDPQLYRACKSDAVKLCHAKPGWNDFDEKQSPNNDPLVLPCLYRYVYRPENKSWQVTNSCATEIRRVMKQRAISVNLLPDIEQACFDDLSKKCFDKTAHGEEIQCLEINLDKLKSKCKEVVSNFIEDQSNHIELNPIISTYCKKMMEYYCEMELKLSGRDDSDIMECLIAHKNDIKMRMSAPKCRASIEHFQLISLKNYHFTYKFKEACKPYVVNLCPKAKSKNDVIECLSERVRNDTIANLKNSISKECRQQLKQQLFQQRENIDFDPKLKSSCNLDIDTFCPNIEHGAAKVLECLQKNIDNLSPLCKKLIFKVEHQEMFDSSIDYTLMTVCQDMLRHYCPNIDKSKALDCLKLNKDDENFDKNCKNVVIQRLVEQYKDYRLNPSLQSACLTDINRFCKKLLNEKELVMSNGEGVIKCLKIKFREAKLSKSCEIEMVNILKQQALNYNLNPLLATLCRKEIDVKCTPSFTNENFKFDQNTYVVECLKKLLLKKNIFNKECEIEVASMIEEAKADIHVDPLLQSTCSIDLMKYCSEVPRGAGRQLKCLETAMGNKHTPLEKECENMLMLRIDMFQNAANIIAPENLSDLYSQVLISPSRRYFLSVAMVIIMFFFAIGLVCGKILSREAKELKNK